MTSLVVVLPALPVTPTTLPAHLSIAHCASCCKRDQRILNPDQTRIVSEILMNDGGRSAPRRAHRQQIVPVVTSPLNREEQVARLQACANRC